MKLTPWFINGELPVRPGVYNVSCQEENQSGLWFCYFNGKLWAKAWAISSLNKPAADKAVRYYHEYGLINDQPASWRGIYNEE